MLHYLLRIVNHLSTCYKGLRVSETVWRIIFKNFVLTDRKITTVVHWRNRSGDLCHTRTTMMTRLLFSWEEQWLPPFWRLNPACLIGMHFDTTMGPWFIQYSAMSNLGLFFNKVISSSAWDSRTLLEKQLPEKCAIQGVPFTTCLESSYVVPCIRYSIRWNLSVL